MDITSGILAGLWTSACMLWVWWLGSKEIKALTKENDRAWSHVRDWKRFAEELIEESSKNTIARLAANAIGQHHGVDWVRGIASQALTPKHYWRLEAAIERAVAQADDRVDNVDIAAVLKRHRLEAMQNNEGSE